RVPHGGGAQRPGLQPLRRHAVLRQQLPVPRAPLQLVELRAPDAPGRAAEPGRDRPAARRHGEVHDVHPAHRGGQGPRARRQARRPRRGHRDGLPADVSNQRHHLRQSEGRGQRGEQAVPRAPGLSRPRRARHAAGRDLSEEGRPRARGQAGRDQGTRRSETPTPPARPISGGAHVAEPTFADVNRDVLATLRPPGNTYFAWMCVVALILTCGILAWTYQIFFGMGAAGKRTPQMWAMYITTFVFWIGIGHAGTLISAVLYLFRARWRTSIYRAAEAMTIFAVLTAGLFPMIHAGRMWFAYFLLPYPNQRYLWPNFKSPLVWDVFAISTYLSISTVFFIVGLVPDLAALRDASTGWRRRVFGMVALGWEGSDRQWRHYRRAYGLFAALATPLVLSVHSVVSWDFAMALVPGWHSTLFAPFFVDGAIFSGFAMVLILVLPMRHFFGLHTYI